ncbi:MAG: glycosyltransferase family A protein [Thermoplasmata archaeon]
MVDPAARAPAAPPGSPEIAIVVAAYRRRRYLEEALASALAAGPADGRREILALVDSEEGFDRDRWARQGVRLRVDPEPTIGRWWLGAIDATTAPYVAFLEDDDRFAPGRLDRALAALRADPSIVFYRNRVRVLSAEGEPVPFEEYSALERDAGLDRTGPITIRAGDGEEGIRRLRVLGTEWFNASTMVFHREILTEGVRPLVAASACPDLFVFLAAVVHGGSLYLDDVRSTDRRRSAASASQRPGWQRLHWEDHARWAPYLRARGPAALATWIEQRTRVFAQVVAAAEVLAPVRAGRPRPEARPAIQGYLRRLLREGPVRSPRAVRLGTAALGCAYQIAPAATRRILSRLDGPLDLP